MGNLLKNLPNLTMGSSLHKIDHIGKYLWYFHPSCGSDNLEITAESQKIFSYPHCLSALSRKLILGPFLRCKMGKYAEVKLRSGKYVDKSFRRQSERYL